MSQHIRHLAYSGIGIIAYAIWPTSGNRYNGGEWGRTGMTGMTGWGKGWQAKLGDMLK